MPEICTPYLHPLKSAEHRKDVLAKLTEWRSEESTTPKLSSDIFYRTWHLEGDAFVVDVGTIEGLHSVHIEPADPRFATPTACEAFLDRMQVPAELRNVTIMEIRGDDAAIERAVVLKAPR